MKGFIYTLIVITVLAGVTAVVYNHAEAPIDPVPVVATSTPHGVVVSPAGEFIMKLYETATVQGVVINVWAVTEDSRCPANANCIWAGRVTVATHIGTAMGTSTNELEPGEFVTTENKKITLKEVLPQQVLNHKIADDEYRFVFKIEDHNPAAVKPVPVTPTPSPAQGKCYVGGCSGQLCSDKPGMASTCEWRESYACYQKTSTCERQPSGQCGWTPTAELSKCLSEAQ
jgi:hypothetical protein